MRKIREVLRLYFAAALSIRAIARSLGTSPSTVGDYLRRAKLAGLSWPLPESVDDTGLERRLFPAPPPSRTERPLPDWSEVHRELRRKSVTLSLLWQEYKETHPEGLQYSRLCGAPHSRLYAEFGTMRSRCGGPRGRGRLGGGVLRIVKELPGSRGGGRWP